MFATLVHKQGKFLAPEKVVPANDFLEREKSGHSLWPWLAALILQRVLTRIFLDLDLFLISSLEMSKSAAVWESFLRNNQSCIFCSPSFCLLYKKFKQKRSPERRFKNFLRMAGKPESKSGKEISREMKGKRKQGRRRTEEDRVRI